MSSIILIFFHSLTAWNFIQFFQIHVNYTIYYEGQKGPIRFKQRNSRYPSMKANIVFIRLNERILYPSMYLCIILLFKKCSNDFQCSWWWSSRCCIGHKFLKILSFEIYKNNRAMNNALFIVWEFWFYSIFKAKEELFFTMLIASKTSLHTLLIPIWSCVDRCSL
jgi:hypothetical protein